MSVKLSTYNFLNFLYDLTWDLIWVSWTIGEHSNRHAEEGKYQIWKTEEKLYIQTNISLYRKDNNLGSYYPCDIGSWVNTYIHTYIHTIKMEHI